MKPDVSIIIPVYNVDAYIEKCLNSIVVQTLKNIEIIVVDDGSTDKSREIIKQFELKDKRIKVIHQKNMGVSEARNNGLKIARGKYIGFVDSDDYIDQDMYESMYKEAIEKNSDIVVCNVNDIYENETKVSLSLEDEEIYLDQIGIESFMKDKYPKFGSAVWHKIFRRELIESNNIRFIDYSTVSSEDKLFNLECMLKSKTISCIKEAKYNYYVRRSGSITSTKASKTNMVNRCKNTVEYVDDYLDRNNLDIDNYKYYLSYTEFLNALSFIMPINQKQIYKSIKEYSTNKLFKNTVKHIALTNNIEKYFINDKGSYNKLYKSFDKLFCLFCLIKMYRAASLLHYCRLKRSLRIQQENLKLVGENYE